MYKSDWSGVFHMNQKAKNSSLSKYAAGAAVWFLSALVLLLASAAAADRLGLDAGQIGWLSCGIVFLSSIAAGIYCRIRTAKNGGRSSGLLLCMALSSFLLILGLTIDGAGMSLLSSLRVLLSALLGACLASLIPLKGKQGRGRKRFKRV